MLRGLVTLEEYAPGSQVLVVTCAWPNAARPNYGIFTKRQVDSVVARGVACDVLFIHGHESPLAYVAAAALLAGWNARGDRAYRLVHAHGGEAGLCARFYARAPLLISYLGSELNGVADANGTVGRTWRIRRRAMGMLAGLARATITKSAAMEVWLSPAVRRRNVVVPNGVNRELFSPQPRALARAALGWPEDHLIVLFAGRTADSNKRFHLAQAACDHAAASVGPIRLEVAEAVSPEQMPTLMSAADCLILTSAAEGSPNVVKEALACDLPVVATAVGDVPAVLESVQSCAVRDGTPGALGDALASILAEGGRSDGRRRTAHLSEPRIAERIISIYRDVGGSAL